MSAPDPLPRAVAWRQGRVVLLDQRALPSRVEFVSCRTVERLCDAIATLAVRGAPALGAAGAYGVALAARTLQRPSAVHDAARRIRTTRPTAVNLAWGVDLALLAFDEGGPDAALGRAEQIALDDVARNRRIGSNGNALVSDGARVLTHCNAGALATAGYGTALGILRAAHEAGKHLQVWVDETRPLLQGARLTAWELTQLGIPATLVPDAAAASLMAAGDVDLVVVGADRIAANGDVANKIGTYGLAVLARHHRIPFIVAAPTSTIDPATPNGAAIPIELRDPDEVLTFAGARVAPTGMAAHNPAFDVTPGSLVSAVVTEVGVARAPYVRSLASHLRRAT